jgi:hypothetical protein
VWARLPDVMLSKCAEALALRKSFPMELSGLYTPDELPPADGEREPAPSTASEQAKNFEEMIGEFSRLKARLGPDGSTIYYEVLAQFGVRHANQFPNMVKARAAYRALLTRVKEYEKGLRAEEEYADAMAEAIRSAEEEKVP